MFLSAFCAYKNDYVFSSELKRLSIRAFTFVAYNYSKYFYHIIMCTFLCGQKRTICILFISIFKGALKVEKSFKAEIHSARTVLSLSTQKCIKVT